MKLTTIGAILLCLICWAFPIKTLASTADQSKPNTQTKSQLTTSGFSIVNQLSTNESDYTSNDIIIKDNALLQPTSVATPPKPKPLPQGSYSGRDYSKEEVQQLIRDYSAQYGISADLPLRVANCESGFNQSSKNSYSTASGVFQYLASTWKNTEAGKAGASVFDADANVHMAIKSIASGGIGNWNASKKCWNN